MKQLILNLRKFLINKLFLNLSFLKMRGLNVHRVLGCIENLKYKKNDVVSIVGSGGKTTLMFKLGRELKKWVKY